MKGMKGIIFLFVCVLTLGGTECAAKAKVNSKLPYVVKGGTVYYETAFGFGSGRRATVKKDNRYITRPCYAAVNGYAYLGKKGRILKCKYIENENDIRIPKAPKRAKKLFLHFKSSFYRNGWVDSSRVVPKKAKSAAKKRKPVEIIREILNIQKKKEKTTIVIDFSQSMDDKQKAVIKLLQTLTFDERTEIIVFADEYQRITKKQLMTKEFDVGYRTHMIQAVNEALSLETENLIIISDLMTFDDVPLKRSDTLKSVRIYDPDDGEEDDEIMKLLKNGWAGTPISRVKIK